MLFDSPPLRFRPPRARTRPSTVTPTPPPPTPVVPVLVAASFDAGGLALTLTFDVAIDAGELDPAQIVVRDGATSAVYAAAGAASVVSPVQIVVPMETVGTLEGGGTLLEASDSTGIIAAGPGGQAWGGAVDLPLPFPVPVPAVVVTAMASGTTALLTFDQPVGVTGSPPDDAILFDGDPAVSVSVVDAHTLSFFTPTDVGPGSTWAIVRQPDWVTAPLAVPQAGTF